MSASTSTRGRTSSRSEQRQPSADSQQNRGKNELLSIGELAKRARVSPRTIRYYEELGILPEPPRTAGGTRRYPREYIFYVEGALLLKDMGFSLEEIGELGRWALDRTSVASRRTQQLLQSKVALLEHRIRVLNRLHDLIVEATRGGRSRHPKPAPELLRLLGEEAQTPNGDAD